MELQRFASVELTAESSGSVTGTGEAVNFTVTREEAKLTVDVSNLGEDFAGTETTIEVDDGTEYTLKIDSEGVVTAEGVENPAELFGGQVITLTSGKGATIQVEYTPETTSGLVLSGDTADGDITLYRSDDTDYETAYVFHVVNGAITALKINGEAVSDIESALSDESGELSITDFMTKPETSEEESVTVTPETTNYGEVEHDGYKFVSDGTAVHIGSLDGEDVTSGFSTSVVETYSVTNEGLMSGAIAGSNNGSASVDSDTSGYTFTVGGATGSSSDEVGAVVGGWTVTSVDGDSVALESGATLTAATNQGDEVAATVATFGFTASNTADDALNYADASSELTKPAVLTIGNSEIEVKPTFASDNNGSSDVTVNGSTYHITFSDDSDGIVETGEVKVSVDSETSLAVTTDSAVVASAELVLGGKAVSTETGTLTLNSRLLVPAVML